MTNINTSMNKMEKVFPILLKPTGKDYLWGGDRLKDLFYKDIKESPLAETWECSTHPDGNSYAVSGIYEGLSLKEILDKHPEYLGKRQKEEFPILIKLIDASKDLSIQVHPTDNYALTHENGQRGKSEFWYVLEAEENAKIVYGFEHDITKNVLLEHIQKGELENDLHFIPAKKGDAFFIKAGTVHAIGKGIVIAEIQENSNLTYRLYDYNRTDIHGFRRELHIEKAFDVLCLSAQPESKKRKRFIRFYPGYSTERLCGCEYFEVERINVRKFFDLLVSDKDFYVVLCIEGKGMLHSRGSKTPLQITKGNCIFLPANLGECTISGKLEFLLVKC